MLQQIQLNDAHAWETLRPGQFVVFLSSSRTDVMLDAAGAPATDATAITVFDSLEEAASYAEQAVARMPEVSAAIYDHRGKSGDPLRRVYHESMRKRFDPERSARRSVWAGSCLLFAFTVWACIAPFRSNEHFLWFYMVGIKMLILGTVLFVRGMGFYLGRSREY